MSLRCLSQFLDTLLWLTLTANATGSSMPHVDGTALLVFHFSSLEREGHCSYLAGVEGSIATSRNDVASVSSNDCSSVLEKIIWITSGALSTVTIQRLMSS
jgi:hypothetical protein